MTPFDRAAEKEQRSVCQCVYSQWNLETLFKCQIRRLLSDLPLDSLGISIGDVSAFAEFPEKLSLPSICRSTVFTRAHGQTAQLSGGGGRDKTESMLIFHRGFKQISWHLSV